MDCLSLDISSEAKQLSVGRGWLVDSRSHLPITTSTALGPSSGNVTQANSLLFNSCSSLLGRGRLARPKSHQGQLTAKTTSDTTTDCCCRRLTDNNHRAHVIMYIYLCVITTCGQGVVACISVCCTFVSISTMIPGIFHNDVPIGRQSESS